MPLKLLFHFYKRFQVQYIFEKHLKSVYLTRYYNIYFIKLIPVSAVLNTKAPQLEDRLIRSSIYQDGERLGQIFCVKEHFSA